MRSKAALCATVPGAVSNARVKSSKKMHRVLPKVISLYIYSSHPHRNFAGTCELTPHYILYWQFHIVSMLTYNVKRL